MKAVAKTGLDGKYRVQHIRDGKVIHDDLVENRVVDQGLTHTLDVVFNDAVKVSAWYLAPFETNYTPAGDDTAANIVARSVESIAYDEANRVLFQSAAASANAVTNSANRAVFTFNATKTIYGIFLTSVATKQSGTGTLMSVAKFTSARSVVSGDELLVTYTMTAQDV